MTYSIVCPYCSHAIKVMDYEEGYQAVVCTVCNKPFVNQTTMTPVFHSFALVGFDSPKVHDVDEYYRDDEPKQVTANSAFLKCPLSKNALYRLDGDHIEVKYIKGTAIRTTWSDVYMMCEEENPTATIKELLGERANTNNVAAVNAFVRAVKGGLIEVDT